VNPIGIAVAATIVALVSSGIAGLTCWRWHAARRTNRVLRRRLATYRHLAADTGRLEELLAKPFPANDDDQA
jgi:hypothetical protein